MPENLNKKVTIRFEGDTRDLVKDTELAIKQLEKVGIAAKKVTQTAVPGKVGRARLTIQGASEGETADVHRRTAAALKILERQTKDTLGVVKNYTVAYDKAITKTKTFNNTTRKTKAVLDEVNKSHRLTVKHVLKYSGAYAAATAAMGGFIAAATSIPKIGMELQATTAVMSASFGGLQGANEQLAFISKLADDAKVSIGELQSSYRKFSASTKLVGLATEETQLIFSNFTKVSRALHLSTVDTESTFRALTQIFNKNKIMAEELQNQLGERIPGTVAAFAKSLGKTTEILNKEMEKGLVKPQYLIAKFSEFLKNKFATAYEQSLNNLQAKLAEGSNAWTRFAQDAFTASEKGLTKLAEWATVVIEFAREHLPETGLAIKVLTALLVGRFFNSLILTIGKTWAWVAANAALIKSYRGLNAVAAQTTFASALGHIKGFKGEVGKAAVKISFFNKLLSKIPHPAAKFAALGLTVAAFAVDIDTASEATITYGDTTVRVTSLTEAAWKNVKTIISPIIEELTNLYDNYAKKVAGNLANTVSFSFNKLKSGALALGDSFRATTEYIPGVTSLWEGASSVADGVTSALFAQAAAIEETEDKAKSQAETLAKAQKESAALQEQMNNARILREAKAKKAKEELITASKALQKENDKIAKSYQSELTALGLQLVKLRESEDIYNRAVAASKGFNKEMQDQIVLLKREIRVETDANEKRKEREKAWEKGKEKLKELNAELRRAENLTKLLTSGGDKIDIINADKLVAANEEIAKLPIGMQAAARETAQLLANQNAYNNRLKKGFDLINNLKSELASVSGDGFQLKLAEIDTSQQAEALRLYRETQLTDLENSLKTEEERIAESYQRRTELILFNTEDGSKRQFELLNRLEQEHLTYQAEQQKKKQTLVLQGYSDILSGINALNEATVGKSSASQKRMLAIQKGIAIAQATINTIAAAISAMNDPNPSPIVKFANYAAVFAQGMNAIAAIRSVNVDAGAFATGGSFTVPGTGGTDSKVVQLRATPGERVTVETPQQQKAGAASSVNVETKINIVNNTPANVSAKSQRNSDGSETITIVVADLENDGPISRNLQQRFGLQRSAF